MKNPKKRTPKAFAVPQNESSKDAKPKSQNKASPRSAKAIDVSDKTIELTQIEDDVFNTENLEELDNFQVAETSVNTKSSGFPFLKIATGAFTLIVGLAIGLWIDALIAELFSRSSVLGWIGTGLVAIFTVTLFVLIMREIWAIRRLNNVGKLRTQLAGATDGISTKDARSLSQKITNFVSHRPETAKGRTTLAELDGDIIDGPELLALTETELLEPLDQKVKQLISSSAKRASIVTAISPRALVDTIYVLFEMVRLASRIAQLYGGRPGFFGTFKLLRNIAAHLAITGAVSLGDGIVEQMIGHGIVAKVSARFGEGLVNGILITRFGILAADVARPMPFKALSRPKLSDFIAELGTLKNQETVS